MLGSFSKIVHILGLCFSLALLNCGGAKSVDLGGSGSELGGSTGSSTGNSNSDTTFTSETVEDDEVVQSIDDGAEGEDNTEAAVNAPELGYVTGEMVYIDCSERTSAGSADADYVSLTCEQEGEAITYKYYCTASVDEDDNEIFIVSRDTDDEPVQTDELFQTILVTCQTADEGGPELFEEEYIVS